MALFKPWTWFGKLESKLFGDNGIDGTWRSFLNQYTRNNLTGAEQEQNQFNAEQAQINRDYQTEMSNTAYQRQVADMQKAGVNPALMYGGAGSSGASTPSGSAASGSALSGLGMSDLMSAILGASKAKKEIALLGKQADLVDAEIRNKDANTAKTSEETRWIAPLNNQQLEKLASEIGVNKSTINRNEYLNSLDKARELQILKDTSWIDRINEATTEEKAASAARDFAEAAISQYEKTLGYRLGSNSILALATAIGNAFHIDITAPFDQLEKWLNTDEPNDWTKALAGKGGKMFIEALAKALKQYGEQYSPGDYAKGRE